jgi:hypothetical protein
MGHCCRICGRTRANEKFSGRGHRDHVCKDCQRLPRAKRDHIEHLEELRGFLDQSHISAKNIARLEALSSKADAEVQRLATLILDVALVHPFKRRRWRHLAARHRDVFHRAVAILGPEFFHEVLMDYGDTGGPLWDALEEYQEAPRWTARPCDCGSGLPFRDCYMERENAWADGAFSADSASSDPNTAT